jgi:hypothetical protein
MRHARLLLLGLLFVGCGNNSFDNGFAVDLVLELDPSVAGAAASIRTLEIDASGADTTMQTMVPTALPSGTAEHLIYRPNATMGTIMFTAAARDASGADVAFGQGTAELRSGATTTLTITLGNSLPPPPDFGFVPPDMMVPNAPVVTPATLTLPRLGTHDFTASAPVTWSVVETSGGSIDNAGHYTAPGVVGTYHVQAALVDDPNVTTTAAVTLEFTAVDVIAGAPGGQGAVDGTGTNARFGGGEGLMAIDTNGNLYLPDRSNQTLRRTTSAGVVTTIVGQVGRTPPTADVNSQLLNDPLGVAVNAAGTTVYLTECSNHTVSRIDYDSSANTWTKKVIAGQPGVVGHADGSTGVNALLNCPAGVALDETNSLLYVAEYGEDDIRKITLSGTYAISTLVGVPGTCSSVDSGDANNDPPTFCNPYGLAFDGSATLFVADSGNRTVRKVVVASPTTGAGTTTIAGTAGVSGTDATHFVRPVGVAYLNTTSLYVVDQSGEMVRQIQLANSNALVTIAGTASTAGYMNGTGSAALFNSPSGVTLVGSTAYVWDAGNFVVRSVGLTNPFNTATLAGSAAQYGTALQNGTGAASRFDQPVSLAVDQSGDAYVADRANCAIRKIVVASSGGTYSATVSTIAGGGADGKTCGATNGAGSSALFGPPQSLLFDGQHTLYVAENSLRSVDLSSASATVATAFSPPVQARGVALDRRGLLYVTLADQTISRFDPVTAELVRLWGRQNLAGSTDGFGEMAAFASPASLLLDGAKDLLYVSDSGNHTLRRITLSDGYVSTAAGSAGAGGAFTDGPGSAARLGATDGMALLPDGRIVFADTGAHAIRIFDPMSQQVTTLAGTLGVPGVKTGALPGGVSAPHGVAMLPTGELLVSDIGEQVVQIVH